MKNNGCAFCADETHLIDMSIGDVDIHTYVSGKYLVTDAYDNSTEEKLTDLVDISVCPVCGKALEEREEEKEEDPLGLYNDDDDDEEDEE